LVFFAHIIRQHLQATRLRQHYQYLKEMNEKELRCIDGDFASYPNGNEYLEKGHAYSSDLDIFGRASLFQLINRTTSLPGSATLAKWLNSPAADDEITRRQQAIAELKDKTEWRQQLSAIGYKFAESANNPENILSWANEAPIFLERKQLKALISILSILSAGCLWAWIQGAPAGFLVIVLLINFFILRRWISTVNQIHQKVSRNVELLKSYSETVAFIENETFSSQKLIELQYTFRDNAAYTTASEQIKKLSQNVSRLDFRLNIMVSIPLNLFFFWDIWQCVQLEKWKQLNREKLPLWFAAMAEIEALCSFANLYHNNPQWVFPTILPGHFTLVAEAAGHPLIPETRRVCNDLSIQGSGKIVLVTGSNMAGKSTFQRTIGVNIVLAMAGAPVCARHFEVSHVTVFTSMRIADSLEENTSSFYAELKRLGLIIQTVERNEKVFLLLDEILRGTNSNDRHIGSEALVKQLIKHGASGIVATHDLALSELKNDLGDSIDNYNFDVKIENDEMYFDYKLNKGVCKSLNASILMKKMGIKI